MWSRCSLISAHSSSVNGLSWENIAAWAPWMIESLLTPARPRASPSTALPSSTPIEPVIVPGWATMTSAAMAM